MKKLLITTLSILLVCALVAPFGVASAMEQTAIYFFDPVSMVVVDNTLYVADKVDNNKSVLWCFSVTETTHNYLARYEFDSSIVNLSSSNGQLFVLYADCIEVYTPVASSTTHQLGQAEVLSLPNAVDICHGIYSVFDITRDVLYYIDASGLLHCYEPTTQSNDVLNATAFDTSKPMSLVSLDQIMYVCANGTVSLFQYQKMPTVDLDGTEDDQYVDFNVGSRNGITYFPDFTIQGIFFYEADNQFAIAVYNSNDLYKIEYNKADRCYTATNPLGSLDQRYGEIIDVAQFNNQQANYLFVLNNDHTIVKYSLNADKIYQPLPDSAEGGNIIGSDIVTGLQIPTSFSGYTLAKPNGYPANIIYKTENSATSNDEIVSDFDGEYIILHYAGDHLAPYYYVLAYLPNSNGEYGYKYGWVIKSDELRDKMAPEEDSKIAVIDNSLDSALSYNAKFNSLNGVYIYDLPLSDSNQTAFSQTATTMTDVNILQSFTENAADGSTKQWYYVSYATTNNGVQHVHTGFVPAAQVSYITAVGANTSGPIVGLMKINSSILSKVDVYDVNGQPALDQNGNPISLYSGDLVNVISIDEQGKALVQIEDKHTGQYSYGYIDSTYLMGRMELSNNSILGLSVLGGALLLTLVFGVIFLRRRKSD